MSKTFLGWALLLAVAGIAIELTLAIWFWPTDWEDAQQATLAVPLITATAAIITGLLKAIFEELSTRAAHERNVKAKLLERFLENRATYLEQLNAVAGELAVSLDAVADYPSDSGHLDFAFYHSARYLELVAALRARFQRLVPPQYMPGFVLQSQDAEHRIWDLILEPWAFGYSTSAQQSALLESLRGAPTTDGKRDLVSPQDFVKARDATGTEVGEHLRTAWTNLKQRVKDPPYARAMARVLMVLNKLLTYEIATVLQAWYGKSSEYPTAEINRAQTFFDGEPSVSLDSLGVTLPPAKTP